MRIEGSPFSTFAGMLNALYPLTNGDPRQLQQYKPEVPVSDISDSGPAPLRDHDPVNHPSWYTSHPSGVEAIDIVEHFPYNIGAAMKYLWRAGLKTTDPMLDLNKAAWYINREIERRQILNAATRPEPNQDETA